MIKTRTSPGSACIFPFAPVPFSSFPRLTSNCLWCSSFIFFILHPTAVSLRGLLLYLGSYHPVLKKKKENLPSFCLVYSSKHSSENITSLGKCNHYPATLAYSGHNSQLYMHKDRLGFVCTDHVT